MKPYFEHLLSYIDLDSLRPMKLVVNAGNGSAGPVIDAIEAKFQQQGVASNSLKYIINLMETSPMGFLTHYSLKIALIRLMP